MTADLPRTIPPATRLDEIEALQDQVLAELEALNREIERVLVQHGGLPARRPAPATPLPSAA